MPTVAHREGEYQVELTSINDELYTFRYIPRKQESRYCMIISDSIKRDVENGVPLEEIRERFDHMATDISVEKGNTID